MLHAYKFNRYDMPQFSALYRIYQGTDIVPFFLVVSPRGGFSEVFESSLQAGSVARIEDDAVEVALAGETLSLLIESLMELRQTVIPTYAAFPFTTVQEPGKGRFIRGEA